MSNYLFSRPQVLALLQQAKEHPQEDNPRLVLADYLEENGDPDRADHIRLGCQLAPGGAPLEASRRKETEERLERLEEQHGGAWLGSLWRWWLIVAKWHRGLLTVKLPRKFPPEAHLDVLPWIDTLILTVGGWQGFQRVARFLERAQVNHLTVELHTRMREDTLLEMLAGLPGSTSLRSLSIHWPLRLLHLPAGEGSLSSPVVSEGFLTALLRSPLCCSLTHLGSSRPFAPEKARLIRSLGVEPVHAENRLWMHRLPPGVLQAKSREPCTGVRRY